MAHLDRAAVSPGRDGTASSALNTLQPLGRWFLSLDDTTL